MPVSFAGRRSCCGFDSKDLLLLCGDHSLPIEPPSPRPKKPGFLWFFLTDWCCQSIIYTFCLVSSGFSPPIPPAQKKEKEEQMRGVFPKHMERTSENTSDRLLPPDRTAHACASPPPAPCAASLGRPSVACSSGARRARPSPSTGGGCWATGEGHLNQNQVTPG